MNTESLNLPFARNHAFVIGINDYEHITPLKTAVNDAIAIAHKLKSEHGYEVHGPLLNPTREDMLNLFATTMMQEVGKDDRVVFYFAGHGIALDGDGGPNGYLVPVDAKQGVKESLVPMEDLHWTLNELPCRHGLLILDCCFSGAFKWSTGYRDLVFDLPKVIYEERFWRYVKDPAWQVITSSAYDQKAVDIISNQSIGMREEGESRHSPFAQALMEAISGKADVIPAGKGDGVITASELYSYLRDVVESETNEHVKRQSPSMFNLGRHDKGEFIFLDPHHQFNLPPTPDRNPFKGLSSYDEADSSLYFGRDRVVEALLNHVYCYSMVVVSGASGTGKSSLIKAGVLPQLRENGGKILPIIRPGKTPMDTLEKELPGLERLLKSGQSYVLVIDQYEELLTQCLDPEDRIAFEQQLADWLNAFPNLFIIISIRSDFEPHFEQHGLEKWWQEGRFVVPGFSLDEYREVIVKPTRQEVLFFEPEELIDQLVAEVSQAPGALPLLSFTLSELYHAYLKSGREDRALTMEDYKKLGGVIGALRTRADTVYESQDEDHKRAMRNLMLRMVSLEGGELASRRVLEPELVFSDEEETKRIKQVARQLVAARLIFTGTDGQGHKYYEPAHDALVRAWSRLWEWIKTVGESKLSLQYKLGLAVKDYREHEDSPDAKEYLWNEDPRLDLLRAVLMEDNHSFNAQEESFVRESIGLRKKKARTRKIWIGVIIVVLFGITLWAVERSLHANEQTSHAQNALADLSVSQGETQVEAEKAIQALKEAKAAQAKAEAQTARADSVHEKMVQEMIEASWKTGTYLNEPTHDNARGETGLKGVRDLYEKVKLVMNLEKARSLSPVPIFVSGPHKGKVDFDVKADQFGHYNPEFLEWAKNHVIPAKNNPILRRITQPFYDKFMQDMARAYYLAYVYVEDHPSDLQSVKKSYLDFVANPPERSRRDSHGGGGSLLSSSFPYPPEFKQLNLSAGNMDRYYFTLGGGFWVRRSIDTTGEAFFGILTDLLKTYDSTWYRGAPK